MKTELRARYLHHLLSKKKKDEGFTLVELLVVVIIIGVLAAIALPTFLGQANKAREAGAKSGLSVLNRSQQAYAVENNGDYADDIATLTAGSAPPAAEQYEFTTADTGTSNAATSMSGLCAYSGNAINGTIAKGTCNR